MLNVSSGEYNCYIYSTISNILCDVLITVSSGGKLLLTLEKAGRLPLN